MGFEDALIAQSFQPLDYGLPLKGYHEGVINELKLRKAEADLANEALARSLNTELAPLKYLGERAEAFRKFGPTDISKIDALLGYGDIVSGEQDSQRTLKRILENPDLINALSPEDMQRLLESGAGGLSDSVNVEGAAGAGRAIKQGIPPKNFNINPRDGANVIIPGRTVASDELDDEYAQLPSDIQSFDVTDELPLQQMQPSKINELRIRDPGLAAAFQGALRMRPSDYISADEETAMKHRAEIAALKQKTKASLDEEMLKASQRQVDERQKLLADFAKLSFTEKGKQMRSVLAGKVTLEAAALRAAAARGALSDRQKLSANAQDQKRIDDFLKPLARGTVVDDALMAEANSVFGLLQLPENRQRFYVAMSQKFPNSLNPSMFNTDMTDTWAIGKGGGVVKKQAPQSGGQQKGVTSQRPIGEKQKKINQLEVLKRKYSNDPAKVRRIDDEINNLRRAQGNPGA